MTTAQRVWRRVWAWSAIVALVFLVLGLGSVFAQGPFTAQIENFWRLISNGGRTFANLKATNVTVTGVCTGCGGAGGGAGIIGSAGKRVMYAQKGDGDNVSGITWVGTAAGTAATGGTFVNDAFGFWVRAVDAGTTGLAATISTNKWFTTGQTLPKLVMRIRTPAGTLLNCRILIGLGQSDDVSVGTVANADLPSTTTEKGLYFRYSTTAADAGWVGMTVDTARTISPTITTIASGTIYLLTLTVNSTSSAVFDVNGTAQTVTTNIPATTLLGWQISFGATLTAGCTGFDLQSAYLQSN